MSLVSKETSEMVFSLIDKLLKIIGIVTALSAAIAWIFPGVGNYINRVAAERFGATGYVYYEIGKDFSVTGDGELYLLRSGEATFDRLKAGDKFQANSAVSFREGADKASRPIFLLSKGDCVIMLESSKKVEVKTALSGGWIRVATTACGLFK